MMCNGATWQQRMTFTSAGYVGIGTTGPNAPLDVQNTGVNWVGQFKGSNNAYITVTNGTKSIYLQADGGGGPRIGSLTNNNLDLATNGNAVMTLTTGGNVGIGTASPQAVLDLSSSGAMLVPRGTTAQQPSGINGMLRYNSSNGKFEGYQAGAWQDILTSGGGASVASPDRGIQFNSGGSFAAASTFTYTSAGYVGIGTASPSSPLHVVGDVNTTTKYLIGGVTALAMPLTYNTAVGSSTLTSLSTGGYNTAVGSIALVACTTCANNTAVGLEAGRSITTAGYVTAIGAESQRKMVSVGAAFNTSIGYGSMFGNPDGVSSTGTLNTAIGGYSLQGITSGNYNTGLGYLAGGDVTTGSSNIIIGAYPTNGVGITTGANNIMLGYDIRPPSQTASNQLNIGNLIYATGLASGATASTGSIGIGTTTPQAFLDLSSTGAMIVPRGTTAQQPSGINGMLRYNSSNGKFEGYQAGAWQDILTSGGGASVASPDRGIQFNSGGSFAAASTFTYTSAGNVGIGTAAPTGQLDIRGAQGAVHLEFANTTDAKRFILTSSSLAGKKYGGLFGLDDADLRFGTDNSLSLTIQGSANGTSGNVGIGTTAPGAKLHSLATTEQLRLGYDSSNYASFTVGSGGLVDIAASSNQVRVNGAFLFNGSSYLSTNGAIVQSSSYSGALTLPLAGGPADQNYVGTSGIFPAVQTRGTMGAASGTAAYIGTDITPKINTTGTYAGAVTALRVSPYMQSVTGVTSNLLLDVGTNSALNGTGTHTSNLVVNSAGNVGIGTATPLYKLDVAGDVRVGGNNTFINNRSSNTQQGRILLQTNGVTKYALGLLGGGFSTSGSDKFAITQEGAASELFVISGSNVGIGTTSPQALLDVSGTDAILFPRGSTAMRPASPVNGMVRYNSSGGNFEGYQSGSWLPFSSGSGTTLAIDDMTDAITQYASGGSMYLGSGVGASGTGGGNTALGYNAFITNTAAQQSTAIGYESMHYANSTGSGTATFNTAVGAYSLQGSTTAANNTGTRNTAVGHSALIANTAGSNNTSGGYLALGANTSGGNNTALGSLALPTNTTGDSNLAIGSAALYRSTTGGYNTAIAGAALYNNTTGNFNVAVGYNALDVASTGSNNVVLGYSVASTTLATGSSNILIGTSSAVDTPAAGTNNWLNIGSTLYGNLSTHQIAIGSGIVSITAGAALDLGSNTNSLLLPVGSAATRPASPVNGMLRYNSSGGNFEGYQSGSWLAFSSGGGGTSPAGATTQIQFNSGGAFGASSNLSWDNTSSTMTVTGDINYTGILVDTSDRRLKTDIAPLGGRGSMLEKLGQIGTYSFAMKSDPKKSIEFGVMAQELQGVFPELVRTDESTPEHYMAVNYIGLIAPMIRAMQEQQAMIERQQAQIEHQSQQIDHLLAVVGEARAARPRTRPTREQAPRHLND